MTAPRCRGRVARAAAVATCVGLASVACGGDRSTAPRRAVTIANVTAAPNALNALSIAVTFDIAGADSARVICEGPDGRAEATPFATTPTGHARRVALGLEPSTAYRVVVEAYAAGAAVRSAPIDVVTGALPLPLQSLRLTGTGQPTSGFTLAVPIAAPTDTVAYVVAFDATGRVAWYREFVNQGWTVEAKQQVNGDITVYLGHSFGWQPTDGGFVEIAPSGEVVRRFNARSTPYTDPHELRLTFRGDALASAALIGYRLERTDLSALGGPRDTAIAVHVLERQDAAGAAAFTWDAGAWYSPTDWPPAAAIPTDLVHPSAFAIDGSGDYVVSLQAIDEIAKVDATTGAVRWRFGGRRNEFTILDDPLDGFHGQHSVRVLENGNLLLFDNRRGVSPPAARAVEYRLDLATMTARLVWEFRPSPMILSPIMGSVERLANGNTVIGFAIPGRVMEVDATARVVWDAVMTMSGRPTPFYRAIHIASLYTYLVP